MSESRPISRLPFLVVEDESVLRLYVLDLVEEAGFEPEPVEATSAAEAIRIIETRTDIRIVYMDLDMPRGVRGIEIAAAIRDRWPPIDIILTATFLSRADINLPARAEFYSKPIQHDQMIEAMQRMTRHWRIEASEDDDQTAESKPL